MNPQSLLKNPILQRELTSRLRSPSALIALAIVAVVSCGLVLMRWPAEASIDLVSQGSIQVFRPVTYAIAIAIMMLSPAFPATAIVSGQRAGNAGSERLLLPVAATMGTLSASP